MTWHAEILSAAQQETLREIAPALTEKDHGLEGIS